MLSEKFVIVDGVWYHVRVEFELLKSCERIAKASASAHARWDAHRMLPTPTTHKEESKKTFSNDFVVGKKNGAGKGKFTIDDPDERLARFQKWLAEAPGKLGWPTVIAGSDPKMPSHLAAIELCRARAKELGKGLPPQWPTTLQ